jgi:hypothetical protein
MRDPRVPCSPLDVQGHNYSFDGPTEWATHEHPPALDDWFKSSSPFG